MGLTPPAALTATEAARRIAVGSLSSEQCVQACLARIDEREPSVQAWQHLDAHAALAQARERDLHQARGGALGPLHGVPVGIKDIIDTDDMPTENGSVLHAGRQPLRDAWLVARLRSAGAVILGKTVTTEFATYTAGKTRNPHDLARTPGGSSSGSAAAVADGMVPLAVGTQTNASIIRPASFCGVYGFKPSIGAISCDGALVMSPTLDTIGLFARSLDDIALLFEPLSAAHATDPATWPPARLAFAPTWDDPARDAPRLAFVRTPVWGRADDATRSAFIDLSARLGPQCEELALPESMLQAWEWHKTVMEAEMAVSLDPEWHSGRDRLSPSLRSQLGRGREILALDYQQALAGRVRLCTDLARLLAHFDAIITPAACGTAPPFASTGDPSFGTLWSLCGMPAISLPLLGGADGLPLGVQLVGARGGDAGLLRTARWLETALGCG